MKLLSSTLLKYHGTEPGLCEDSRWMVNKVLLNRRGRRGMRRGTQSTPFSATSAKNSATSAVSFIHLSPLNRVFHTASTARGCGIGWALTSYQTGLPQSTLLRNTFFRILPPGLRGNTSPQKATYCGILKSASRDFANSTISLISA